MKLRDFLMGLTGGAITAAGLVFAQTTARVGPVDDYNITAYPLYGVAASQNDSVDLATPGMLRADSAGAVSIICWGNTVSITVNLAAGEFVPCVVKRLLDTGTDAITIHEFY